MGTVPASKGFRTRQGRKDRRDAIQLLAKTHVVIPFVVDCKWLYPRGDRMIRQQLKVRSPMGVYRPMSLEIATDPLQEVVARRTLWHFYAIVETGKANPALHDFVEFL